MQNKASVATSQARMSSFFHKKRVVMRASVECRIRTDRKSSTDHAAVYLQVIINSKRTTIPLNASWPVERFDNKAGKFLERHKGDQLAIDYNLHVTKEKAKINDIFMYYRHTDIDLDISQFKREYERYGQKHDFYAWALDYNNTRYMELKIEKQTWKNRKSQIKTLQSFQATVRFSDLNCEFLERAEAWFRKREMNVNSFVTILKMIQSTARAASRKGVAVNIASLNSYKAPATSSRIIYLTPNEIKRMETYYGSAEIPESEHQVLGYFLFACNTGLRFSDIQRVSWKHIADDILQIMPYKTRKSQKIVRIPIIEEAYQYIHNERGLLFNCLTEPATNRILKRIASACKVRKNLTTHVARHTFATEFLRRDGHIEVLKELLGHKKISSTMIYVHVDTDRLRDEMRRFARGSATR